MTMLEEVVEITIVRQFDCKESEVGGKHMYELAIKGWNYRLDRNNLTNKEILGIVEQNLKYIPHLREHLLSMIPVEKEKKCVK